MHEPKCIFKKWKVFFLVILLLSLHLCIDAQMRQAYVDNASADNEIHKISFYNSSSGFVAFRDWLGFTSDSGHTFIKKYVTTGNVNYGPYSVNLTFGFWIAGVKAFDQNTVVLYGHYGLEPTILYSNDAGNSFTVVYHRPYSLNQANGGITDIAFPENNSIGYAVDLHYILKTTNGGISWSVVGTNPNSYFSSLEALDNNHVYAISNHYSAFKILHTINGGLSWSTLTLPALTNGMLRTATFRTDTKGWIIMENAEHNYITYITSNGGSSWTAITDQSVSSFLGDKLRFFTDSVGYALGPGLFTVSKTRNGGRTWESLPRDNTYSYLAYAHNDLYCLNENQLWAGGGHGFLELSTNGGGTPLPKAFFRIDTTGFYSNNTINLLNYSNPGYQYKWYKNNVLISTVYSTSYSNASSPLDSIKLVVSDGIYKDTVTKYQYFNFASPPPPVTGWTLKPTNINDNLGDIRMLGNVGVIIGTAGIYVTTTGVNNPNGWSRFKIINTTTDSQLLIRTRFSDVESNERTTEFYLCGNDTVNNKAIIFRVNPTTGTYSFIYTGASGTKLNAMTMTEVPSNEGVLHAVGNNGLNVIHIIINGNTYSYNFSDHNNLLDIFPRNTFTNNVGVVSDSVLYLGSRNSMASSYNLGRKVMRGGSIDYYGNFTISQNTLYQKTQSSILDSIVKTKVPALEYTSIAHGQNGNYMFLGTNKGIFKIYYSTLGVPMPAANQVIEYQPTSLGKYINNIWFKEYAEYDTGYAVGPNGTLLVTVNFGGPTVPYSSIASNGNCLGSLTPLTGYSGTGTSCKWFVDDLLRESTCGGTSTTIGQPGQHTLRYVVSNAWGLSDTTIKTIYVSPMPTIDLPVMVNDTILCKSEPLIISIQNTQGGYQYDLIQESTGVSAGSVISMNGGQVFLSTTPIAQSGRYFIRVSSTLGGCIKDFIKRINITVEHPHAAFLADRLNITTGEELNFYQRSTESQTFLWAFNEDANIPASSVSNPQHISYASAGQKTLSLIATTAFGCMDTLTSNAVYVYNKPVPDNVCYASRIDTISAYGQWQAHIAATKEDGFMICGNSNIPSSVKSMLGKSAFLPFSNTSYLAKYTTDGALQWLHYFKNDEGEFTTSISDKNGNIYIAGRAVSNAWLHFQNGDSMRFVAQSTDTTSGVRKSGFILKLDSAGHYLWHTIIYDPTVPYSGTSYMGAGGQRFAVLDNHIVLTGWFTAKLSYWRNGTLQPLYDFVNNGNPDQLLYNFALKIREDGSLVWISYFKNGAVNYHYALSGTGIDQKGNSYVTGYYEQQVIIGDAVGTINTFNAPGYGYNSFVVKFDSTGKFIWRLNYQGAKSQGIATDDAGNCYITGSGNNAQVISADNSTHALNTAGLYILKVNSDGIYRWSAGTTSAYYSNTYSIFLKDGNLYVPATVSNNGQSISSFTFISTDGDNWTLPVYESEMIVLKYDTTGSAKRIIKSGQNAGGHINAENLFIDSHGNFIMGGNTDNGNGGNGTAAMFGTSMVLSNAGSGFFAKVNPDFCFSSSMPVADAGPDKSICTGDSTNIGVPGSGSMYYWRSSSGTFTSTLPNPKVSPQSPTIYYLKVFNNAGVVARDTAIVYPAQCMQLCPNGSVMLAPGLSGQIYQWQMNTGNGFINVSDNVNMYGANTQFLQLQNIPSSWYGADFRCVVDGVAGPISLLKIKSTWTGAVSTDWQDAGNWDCNVVPDDNVDLMINAGAPHYPQIGVAVTCRTLTLANGVNLVILTGGSLNVRK
jgi:photosystem II stability/assembly factor-like uncharacterized protein